MADSVKIAMNSVDRHSGSAGLVKKNFENENLLSS